MVGRGGWWVGSSRLRNSWWVGNGFVWVVQLVVVDVRVLGKLLGRFFGDSHGGWCFFPEDGLFGCCACLCFGAALQTPGLV